MMFFLFVFFLNIYFIICLVRHQHRPTGRLVYYNPRDDSYNFVCLFVALSPGQQIFSHFGTTFCV